MQRVFFIADTHFGHPGVLNFRDQFTTVDEHDEFVVGEINETVNPTDTLIILGDAIITPYGVKAFTDIRCRNIIIVPGNHDGERFNLMHVPNIRIMGNYEYKDRDIIKGMRIVGSHIPINPACLDRWNLNIHGHLHDYCLLDKRFLCLSAEAVNYTPVTKEWIAERFLERGVYDNAC